MYASVRLFWTSATTKFDPLSEKQSYITMEQDVPAFASVSDPTSKNLIRETRGVLNNTHRSSTDIVQHQRKRRETTSKTRQDPVLYRADRGSELQGMAVANSFRASSPIAANWYSCNPMATADQQKQSPAFEFEFHQSRLTVSYLYEFAGGYHLQRGNILRQFLW